MFELIHDVEFRAKMGDVIEGVVTKETTWIRPRMDHRQTGAIAIRAESVNGFMQWLDATKNETRNYYATKASDRYSGSGWQAFSSLKEAYETFRDRPWDVRTFSRNDVPLKFAENVGNAVEYDVTGDYIDMGRFLDGEPECWGHNVMGNPQGLFATIVINLSASAFFEGEALRRRGERITRLVDWLESQHIRTEILAINASECAHVEIVVKRYDEPLNIDTVAVVGHSDFYRRLIFRVMEMSRTWTDGHGTAILIDNGRMDMPKLESRGILIFSESAASADIIDTRFDKLEKELGQALEDGDRYYRSAV